MRCGFLHRQEVEGGNQAEVQEYGHHECRLAALTLIAFGQIVHGWNIDWLKVELTDQKRSKKGFSSTNCLF